jgi:hypothetical protein
MTCEEIVGSYIGQLKGDFACLPAPDNRLRLITPYLYPDHDRIELFIRTQGEDVTISDLGETLTYLETTGLEIIGNTIREFKVHRIAEGVGVEIERGIIAKRGKLQDVGELIFDVVTACKAIGDLVYSTRAYEPALFEEEVAGYLIAEHFHVEPRAPIVGKSGTNYKVNLRVKVGLQDALVATISPKTPKGSIRKVNDTFRMWSDVNGDRIKYSVFNDEVALVRPEDVFLLQQANSRVFRWSAREEFLRNLKGLEQKR